MINTRILLIPLLVACYAYLSAQTSDCNVGFDQISPALGEYFSTGSQFADADNDGDLDFFVFRPKDNESTTTIPPQIRLFQNNGTSFSLFLTLTTDRFDLADINGDGLIDIVSIDPDIGNSLRLYINTGTSFTFTTIYTAPTNVTFAGYPQFVDYDSDGDLDISCGVFRRSNGAVFILNNDGFQNFTKQERFAISGSGRNTVTDVKWADIDNDGDQDCWGLFEGPDASGLFRTFPDIFLNQGNGTFSDATATPPSADRSVLEDFDNDGTVDMIVWGNGLGGNLLGSNFRFYRGGSSGTNGFVGNTNVGTDQNILDIITFDYDNNGFLDLFVYSRNDLTGASQHIIYRNENGVFTPGGSATNIIFSAPFFCDFNKDNVADYAQYYFTAVAIGSRIEFFSGNAPQSTCPSNSRPKAPDNLGAEVTASSVKLSWQASDADQVSASLTYEIYLANQTTGQVIFAPTSDASTGLRKIAAPGKHGSQGSWTFNNLPDGEYAWRVQAIDHFYSGSPWSAGNFTIGQAACPDYQAGITVSDGFSKYSKWADFDGDGDKDLAIIHENGDNPFHLHLFENNGGTLSVLDPWNENEIQLDHFDLGDADNDGDIDILFVDKSALYIMVNEGNSFSRKEVFNSVEGWTTSRPSWIDYDNDGDLDIVHYNSVFFTQFNGLAFYENQGGLQFEFSNSRPISGKTIIDLRVADFDRDGDVDIIVEESDPLIPDLPQEIRLYLNDGGPFIPGPSVGVTGQGIGGFDIGDIDNDGDIDVVGSGRFQFGASTRFYLNDNLNFAEVTVQDEGFGHVRLGDFDNDGFLDLAASTFEYTSSPSAPSTVQFTKLFRNTGGTSLIAESINFTVPGAQFVNVGVFPEWIDFNNDGILDIYHQFFVSFNETNTELSFFDAGLLHINESSCEGNTPPSPPSGLGVNIDGSDALLSWKEGFDPEQSPISLSYKVFLYDTENQVFIQPHAEPNKGYRHLLGMGNQFQNTSWLIKNLPDGSYCFKVQAIDHTFEGSEWSEEICFQITSCQLTAEAIALDPIICAGESANLRAISSGGNGAVTYQWNNNLGAGPAKTVTPTVTTIYQVTATDEAGCTATDTTSVVVNPRPFVDAQPDTVLCQGESVTLTAMATGGSAGNYQFLWDNNLGDGSTQTVTPTTTTTYIVTVTDGNGCTATDELTVRVNSIPAVTLESVQCDPSLTTYTIQLQTESTNTIDVTIGEIIDNGGGRFTISAIPSTSNTIIAINDPNTNCSREETVTAPACSCPDNIPAPISDGDQEICPGEDFPSLSVTVPDTLSVNWYDAAAGGELIFQASTTFTPTAVGTYYAESYITINGCPSLSRTAVSLSLLSPPIVSIEGDTILCTGETGILNAIGVSTYLWSGGETTASLTIAQAGSYSVIGTAGNGCMATDTVLVIQGELLEGSFSNTAALCNGEASGSSTVNVTGGIAPYTYLWSNGATTPTVAGLTAGPYSVAVTDSNDCTFSGSTMIGESDPLGIISSTTEVSCPGGADGSASIAVTGGQTPYRFLWEDQNTAAERNDLAAGSYTVLVGDANDCEQEITIVISELPSIFIEPIRVQATSCFGVADGLIEVSVGGGTAPYTLNWSNDANTSTIETLGTGDYTLNVVDANDCQFSSTFTITAPEQLAISNTAINSASCEGAANGNIDLTIAGGTPPYRFEWSNGADTEDLTGVAAGTYSVVISDQNDCDVNGNFTIGNAGSIALFLTPFEATCALDNGRVTLDIEGGSAPYTYDWSNDGMGDNDDDANVEGLAAGTYTLSLTDAAGCVAFSEPVAIEAISPPVLEVVEVVPTICGESVGSIDIEVSGGTAPYTYAWSNNTNAEDLSDIAEGSYTVVVSDANDCEIGQEISITCFNPCVVNAGTMGQEKIMACQTEMITATYDASEEVLGEGDIRQFVIHNASGNVIGDIVFAILDEPIVNFLANQMMPGVEYYLSAVVGKQGDDGQVDLGNECLDVAAGTPFSFARAPTAPAELTATNTTLCAGQALDLAVNVPLDGDISYLWETPRGVFTTGTPELTLENFTAEDQGDYFASYNIDGCESEQLGPLFITLDDRAAGVSAGEDQLSCGDISITMAAQLPENSTGTWFTSSPANIIDPTDPNTVVDSLISGENIFIWVGNTGNCIVRDSVTIYHAVSPVTEDKDILLAADKAALLLNKELLFDVITQSIPDSQFVFTITKQPEFGFLTDTLSGLYYLRDLDIQEDLDVSFVYEVCNDDPECGLLCSEATINISIQFLASEMIDYKQALRPEGKNPVWKFTLLRNLSDAKLSIVDRWGQLIYAQFYDSGEYNLLKGNTITGWNGENTKGVQLPGGAYYFLFEGTLADGSKPTPEKGILYLLK